MARKSGPMALKVNPKCSTHSRKKGDRATTGSWPWRCSSRASATNGYTDPVVPKFVRTARTVAADRSTLAAAVLGGGGRRRPAELASSAARLDGALAGVDDVELVEIVGQDEIERGRAPV